MVFVDIRGKEFLSPVLDVEKKKKKLRSGKLLAVMTCSFYVENVARHRTEE
jgi:TusA-related sulfurtransferase